jgi:hypothetical protein
MSRPSEEISGRRDADGAVASTLTETAVLSHRKGRIQEAMAAANAANYASPIILKINQNF